MNGYEKFIKIIKNICEQNKSPQIEIGTYKSGGIQTNNILIPSSMVYKLELCTKNLANVVSGTVGEGGGETHSHSWTDTSTYITPIADGDLIAYQRIDPTKYLIIGRVV